tara:strand:+ start:78 stop:1622 length:1545 start_codon:yes stop_codon:yes gene_type:complete
MPLGAFKVALLGSGSGASDTFVAEIRSDTSNSGSANNRTISGIAVDSDENVYISGYGAKAAGGYQTWFIKTDALFSDFTINRVSDSSATEQGNWYTQDLFNTRTTGSSTDQIWWGGQVNNVSPEFPRWCATMKSDLSEETDTFGGFMWYLNSWPWDSSGNYNNEPRGIIVSGDSNICVGNSRLYENKQSYQNAVFNTVFTKSSTEYAISYSKSVTPGWFQNAYSAGVWLRATGSESSVWEDNDFYFGASNVSYQNGGAQLFRRYGGGHGSEDSHCYYPNTGSINTGSFELTGKGDYLYMQCLNNGDSSTHLCKINEFGTSSGDIVWSRETYRTGQNGQQGYKTLPVIDTNENVWQTHTYQYAEGSVNRMGTIIYRYNSSGTLDRCYDIRQATDITDANNLIFPSQLALSYSEDIIYMAFGAYADGSTNSGAYVIALKTDGSTTGTATLGTGSGPDIDDTTWVVTSDTSYATNATSDWVKVSTSGISWGSTGPNQFQNITATTTAKTGAMTVGAF